MKQQSFKKVAKCGINVFIDKKLIKLLKPENIGGCVERSGIPIRPEVKFDKTFVTF